MQGCGGGSGQVLDTLLEVPVSGVLNITVGPPGLYYNGGYTAVRAGKKRISGAVQKLFTGLF